MVRRSLQIIREAAASLGRSWRTSALAVAAIVSAVFVLGAFLIVSRVVDDAVARWSEAAELSVFMREDADETARAAVERTLRQDSGVRDVRVVSTAEATRRFSKTFPDLAPLVGASGEAPLPASLEARLGREATVPAVMALADRLRKAPGVADVRVDQELLAGILNVTRAGRLVGGVLSAILILAAALAIASVVRLSYVARRDEVDVLYLLGAPLSAIRGPFVAEGALQGAVGTGVAVLLLAIAHAVVVRQYGSTIGDLPMRFLRGWQAAALVAGGIVMGAWAGFAAVRGQRGDVLD
jgi:cell division transport system permease protein